MELPFFLFAVHEYSPAKQERNAPQAGQTHKGVNHPGKQRAGTAEEPSNKVKPEQTDQTPVGTANDGKDQCNGIHDVTSVSALG